MKDENLEDGTGRKEERSKAEIREERRRPTRSKTRNTRIDEKRVKAKRKDWMLKRAQGIVDTSIWRAKSVLGQL